MIITQEIAEQLGLTPTQVTELNKILAFINVKSITELTAVLNPVDGFFPFEGPDGKLYKVPINTFYQLIGGLAKPISPGTTAPTVIGWYKPDTYSADPGTNYPNLGNLKAVEGYDTLFYFDGTTWIDIVNKNPGISVDKVYNIISANKEKLLSNVNGGDFSDTNQNFTANSLRKSSNNDYLNSLGLNNVNYGSAATNYWFFYNDGNSPLDGLAQLINVNKGKFARIEFYIYSKNGVAPDSLIADNLGFLVQASGGNISLVGSDTVNGSFEITQVDSEVFKIEKTFNLDFTGTLTVAYITTVLTSLPSGFVNGDFAVTGFKMAFGETDYIQFSEFIGDWQDENLSEIDSLKVNNLPVNTGKIAPFYLGYDNKEINGFNEYTAIFAGNSHMGRQYETALPYTPDMHGLGGFGYQTGHFPPNMWQQTVPFKILEALQFKDADVKYYNHSAGEISKIGTVNDLFPVGLDQLRLCLLQNVNDSITLLNFTGASFVKFIWSTYTGSGYGLNRVFKVQFSTDNGGTWQTPDALGFTSNWQNTGADGEYQTPNLKLKFGSLIFKGLNKAVTYRMRITSLSGTLPVWGFETWSNPRVNVIVSAEGGNTADDQDLNWFRFYNSIQNPHLIVYELPYANDLGTGGTQIPSYKGKANLSTTPNSPILNDFYYADVDGVYSNFSNLNLKKGDYFEYNGTSWVKGSTQLKTVLANYQLKNENVFKKLAAIGVPVLTLIPHNGADFYNKPYTYENGLSIIRNLNSIFGFASIDCNLLQQIKGLTAGIYTDGLHLNNYGNIEIYVKQILKLLQIPINERFVSSSDFRNIHLKGLGNGASTVNFGFEFSKIPIVRTFNNSSIVVTNVTQNNFTVTGSGGFEWEAIVN